MTRTSDPEGSKHGTQRVYLVAETKGGTNGQAVTRPSERAKIDCAKVYFGEISKGVPGLRIRSAKRIPIKQYAAEKTSRFSRCFRMFLPSRLEQKKSRILAKASGFPARRTWTPACKQQLRP